MFTGIVEEIGTIKKSHQENGNLKLMIDASFTKELKIDQSVAHNGVCLTVDGFEEGGYTVTIIQESLNRSNLGDLKSGDQVNLERCVKVGDRLDGHIVQGHVDCTGIVQEIKDVEGSKEYYIKYTDTNHLTVEKGSICVNGVSLTVVNSTQDTFSVAIIPYTLEHTTFNDLKVGDKVNLEFDIVGKYIMKSK